MNRNAEETSSVLARVRNETRRPCSFRCEGRTIRLGPGEEVRIPEPWLGSLELRRLAEAGRLAVVRPARRTRGGKTPRSRAAKARPAAKTGRSKERRAPRTAAGPPAAGTEERRPAADEPGPGTETGPVTEGATPESEA